MRIAHVEETGVVAHMSNSTAQLSTPWGSMMLYLGKLSFWDCQHAERERKKKPLKENSGKTCQETREPFPVSRRALLTRDNPLSIRASLFSCTWESETLRKLMGSKGGCPSVNGALVWAGRKQHSLRCLELRTGVERLPHGSKDSDHKGNCLLPSLWIRWHLETNLMISAVRQWSEGRTVGSLWAKLLKF